MAMASVAITFDYSTDPVVTAALGGFNVYAVNDVHTRVDDALFVARDDIPTATDPLIVPMPTDATQVEVVPVDEHGYEGVTTYLPVMLGLPPVLSVSQVVMVVSHATPKRHYQ